ncbi:MAG: hypothetical protein R3D01_00930 [Hyphomicrobiales bacterium]
MHIDRFYFVVWAHRSADSVFGAGSNPVVVNGAVLCFKTEEEARAESDRLNARLGGSHVRYFVRPVCVPVKLPNPSSRPTSARPRQTAPFANGHRATAPHAA